jgi:hypothetical protein
MYRDDRLEFNKGSLTIKKTETTVDTGKDGKMMQKQRRSTKFDFSGTNYEVQTYGYLSGIEDMLKTDPNLFTKICDKAKKASGARKPAGEVVEDKFASMRLDPAFLARASLRAKIISGRAIRKETFNADEANDGGDEDEEVMGEDHEAREEEAREEEAREEEAREPEADEDHEPEAAENGYDTDHSQHASGEDLDFKGNLKPTGSELESQQEDEENYAPTEDGSQA